MTLKLKSLLMEQPNNTQTAALSQIIQTHQAIFESTLSKLQSIDYSAVPDEQEMIRGNADSLCEMYITYCKNTMSYIKQYPDQDVFTQAAENLTALATSIYNTILSSK
jgi:hypothetical protein